MKKLNTVATILAFTTTLITPLSASAGIRTFIGNDQHLYLHESKQKFPVNSLMAGWKFNEKLIPAVASPSLLPVHIGTSNLDGEVFISKGPFKISDQRFFELLTQANVAPEFVDKYSATNNFFPWGLSTLGCLVVGGAGFGAASINNSFGNYSGAVLGTGLIAMTVGGLGAIVSAYQWYSNKAPKFSPDEAYDVIQLYNETMDKKSQKTIVAD